MSQETQKPLATRPLAHRVFAGPLAPLLVSPWRFASAAKASGRTWAATTKWFFRSRELANYTYDLTPRNREYLAWFVAHETGKPVAEIRGYL